MANGDLVVKANFQKETTNFNKFKIDQPDDVKEKLCLPDQIYVTNNVKNVKRLIIELEG